MIRVRTRTLLALAATTAVATLGLGASAFASQTATKVTIKGDNGDYYGYVKSSKSSCESNRKVEVFKLKGSSPNPKQ